MIDKTKFAPGCFGSALTYSDDEICTACEFNGACKELHEKALAQLRQFYMIEAPSRVKGALPVKVKRILEDLGKSVDEVREAMQGGRNPYRVKDGFVGLVCHLILTTGTIKRSTIERVLTDHRQFSAETSSVYARQAIQLLSYCDAIAVDGDTITLIRG